MKTASRPVSILFVFAAALAVALLLIGNIGRVAAAGTRYISTTGTDVGTCADLANPCATVTYALGQASPGDTIQIDAGTYSGAGNQNITINNDVVRLHYTGSGWTASKYWNGEDYGYTRCIQAMHIDLP